MDGTGCANIGFNVVAADTAASVPQCRTCIFDLDGLLLATEQLYTEAANQILEDYDCPKMDLRIKAKLMGQSGLKANEIFVKECKLPLTAEQALKRNHELLATKFESVKPMTGALELIAHLASNKVPIAVATSSTQANLNCKRKGNSELFNYFKDMIVTGDDIAKLGLRGKPAPDIYLEALKKINDRDGTDIKPEECLCFEDSVSGIKSVLSAKMQVVYDLLFTAWSLLGNSCLSLVLLGSNWASVQCSVFGFANISLFNCIY